jgi:hypothetical protein
MRAGYTADTLNIFRAATTARYRVSRLDRSSGRSGRGFRRIRLFCTPSSRSRAREGAYPDLALIREIPPHGTCRSGARARGDARHAGEDRSLQADGQNVAAVINTGDLVKDGRYLAHWRRFLHIAGCSRRECYPVAGNHERTDTEDGVENW